MVNRTFFFESVFWGLYKYHTKLHKFISSVRVANLNLKLIKIRDAIQLFYMLLGFLDSEPGQFSSTGKLLDYSVTT